MDSSPSLSPFPEGSRVSCGICRKPGVFSAKDEPRGRASVTHGADASNVPADKRQTSVACFLLKPQHFERTQLLPSDASTLSSSSLHPHSFPRAGEDGSSLPLSLPVQLPEFADLNDAESVKNLPASTRHIDSAADHASAATAELNAAIADASLPPALRVPLLDLAKVFGAAVQLLQNASAATRPPL
jgi:hypothetical protein